MTSNAFHIDEDQRAENCGPIVPTSGTVGSKTRDQAIMTAPAKMLRTTEERASTV